MPSVTGETVSTRARLARGAAWITGARVIVNLLGVISTLVLARLLVPADFGLVAIGTTMLSMLTALTNISMTEALVQHRDPTRQHYDTVWTLNLCRATVIGVTFVALAKPVAVFYSDERLVGIMIALGLSSVIGGVENPRAIMLTKQLIFWQQFMLQVSQRLVTLIASVTIAYIYRSYWALACGIVLGQITQALISYTVLPYRPRPSVAHWKELFSFSMWLSFSQIINALNWNFDQVLIGRFIGKTSLGLYTVGNNLSATPTREVTAPLTATLYPAFVRLAADRSRLASGYQRAQSLVTAITLPFGIGMALVAEPFVRLFMGEKWLGAVFIIQALSCVFALQTLGSLAGPLAMASGQTRLLFVRDTQAFVYRIPLIAIGMYLDGLHGVVYARIIGGGLTIICNAAVVRRVAGLSFVAQLRPNVRALVAAAGMAAIAIPTSRLLPPPHGAAGEVLTIVIIMGIGAATYALLTGVMWVLGGRKDDFVHEIVLVISQLIRHLRPRSLLAK